MHHNDKKVIHVNFDSAAVDPVYFPQLEVVGDIANSIWQIKEGITPQDDWKLDFYKDVHQAYVEHRAEAEDDNRFPILPERLVRDIRKVMPDNGIVTLDNGIYKIWFARNYPAYHPNTLLLDNALASMGAGLPSAIAAKLVKPDAPVLAVCGDGGFMMNSQEIETAVRLKLDLVVIILRDDAYGMIKWKQANMQFDEFGLDYGNPNFVKYAQSYGAQGWRVDDTDVLIHLLATNALETIRSIDGGDSRITLISDEPAHSRMALPYWLSGQVPREQTYTADDAYGMIKWKQANMQFDEFGLDYGNPNFVKYAQSYGAQGWRVDDTDVLIHLVDKCLNTKGVHIIDCPVDYSMNDKTLNHTIKELSAKL